MWFDFRPRGTWGHFNDLVREALGLDLSKSELKAYPNIHVALTETVIVLAKNFPLKKKCVFIKNINPLLEPSLLWLSKEGYEMQSFDESVLKNPEQLVASLGRETLFVLTAEDEPMLGKTYSCEALNAAAVEKGVIHINVSHRAHLRAKTPRTCDRNLVRLLSYGPRMAIAVTGERARTSAISSEFIAPVNFSKSGMKSDFPELFEEYSVDHRDRVSAFEAKNPAGGKALLTGDNRLWDRAVLYWEDMDGHAVIDRLAKGLDIKLAPPGHPTKLETLSLSRWGGVKTFEFYQNLGWAPEVLRGTVILSADIINARLEEALSRVRESILADQFG